MTPTIQYTKHEEIPRELQQYFLSIAETNSLKDIPLKVINTFVGLMEIIEESGAKVESFGPTSNGWEFTLSDPESEEE